MKTLARDRDHVEVARRLQAVRSDSARLWGRMSAHQMVCHLSDAFLMALGRKAVTPADGLFQRTLVKGIALYLPLRWPPGIRTTGELDQEAGAGTPPTEFAKDLALAATLLQAFPGEAAALVQVRHPIFGRMSEGDWMRWGYLHTDHHLRQFGA